ncbi:MAG: hypothetical protein VYB46_01965, partial [Pseudomonadota bacterium]|nr:hypothetical protein [Pseudomonadota bacterium]
IRLEWIDWFNNRRLLEPIGSIPPAEAEANFYARITHRNLSPENTERFIVCAGVAPTTDLSLRPG